MLHSSILTASLQYLVHQPLSKHFKYENSSKTTKILESKHCKAHRMEDVICPGQCGARKGCTSSPDRSGSKACPLTFATCHRKTTVALNLIPAGPSVHQRTREPLQRFCHTYSRDALRAVPASGLVRCLGEGP